MTRHASIDNYVKLIDLIGHGIERRTRMYVFLGINYSKMTLILDELVDKGYVLKVPCKGGGGTRTMAYHLTDRGVRFFRVISEFSDILAKDINSFRILFS